MSITEFDENATRMVREELFPLLFADHSILGKSNAIFTIVSQEDVWDLLHMTMDLLGGDKPSVGPVDYARLNDWITGGLVGRLLCLIIELSPQLDNLFSGQFMLGPMPKALPGWQWLIAMRVIVDISSCYAERKTTLDAGPGMEQLRKHSISLFRTLLDMDSLFSTEASSEAAEQTVLQISSLCFLISQLILPETVSKSSNAMRAELGTISLRLTMRIREFLTTLRLRPKVPPRRHYSLSPDKIHERLWVSAVMAEFCMQNMIAAGAFGRPKQVVADDEIILRLGSGGLSIPSLTGLSAQRIVEQTTHVDRDSCRDNQKHRRYEYSFLAFMAQFDPAPSELIRALCERSYLPETMAIAKAALSDAEFMVNHHDRRLNKMTTDKSDHFALEYFGYAWYLCMVLSLRDGLSHIPMDAVDSGILFLLELMALNHYDQSEASTTTRLYLNELPRAIYRALGAEYAIGENKLYTHKMIHQIVVIHKRISSRPGVSQFLVKSWSETVIWAHVIHPSISVEAVCNNPGCERIDVPNLQCRRCRSHKYCSKDCQRADWKFHKPHCSPSK